MDPPSIVPGNKMNFDQVIQKRRLPSDFFYSNVIHYTVESVMIWISYNYIYKFLDNPNEALAGSMHGV